MPRPARKAAVTAAFKRRLQASQQGDTCLTPKTKVIVSSDNEGLQQITLSPCSLSKHSTPKKQKTPKIKFG